MKQTPDQPDTIATGAQASPAEIRTMLETTPHSSDHFYAHPVPQLFGNFLSSDGFWHLCQMAHSFWLLDAIASHQAEIDHTEDRFQLWELLPVEGNNLAAWRLTMRRDSGEPPVVTQEIPYSDFPLSEGIKLYCIHDDERGAATLMLPKEY